MGGECGWWWSVEECGWEGSVDSGGVWMGGECG